MGNDDHKGDERATKTMKTTKMTETTKTMMMTVKTQTRKRKTARPMM